MEEERDNVTEPEVTSTEEPTAGAETPEAAPEQLNTVPMEQYQGLQRKLDAAQKALKQAQRGNADVSVLRQEVSGLRELISALGEDIATSQPAPEEDELLEERPRRQRTSRLQETVERQKQVGGQEEQIRRYGAQVVAEIERAFGVSATDDEEGFAKAWGSSEFADARRAWEANDLANAAQEAKLAARLMVKPKEETVSEPKTYTEEEVKKRVQETLDQERRKAGTVIDTEGSTVGGAGAYGTPQKVFDALRSGTMSEEDETAYILREQEKARQGKR